jgi:hypothetical protein
MMVRKNIPPTIWSSDDAYQMYCQHIDSTTSPLDFIKTSVNTILSMCDKMNIDTEVFFDHVSPSEVTDLIRQRRMSPWFLLNSKTFKKKMVQCSEEELMILGVMIDPDYWMTQLEEHSKLIPIIKEIVSELGL